MTKTMTVPQQIQYWIKRYMDERGLTAIDYMQFNASMKEVIKSVHERSPTLYCVGQIARATGKSEATISKCITRQAVGV